MAKVKDEDKKADYSTLMPKIDRVWEQIRKHRRNVKSSLQRCWTTDYAKHAKKAYQQVRVDGAKYYVHVIAAMKACHRAPKPGEEASHLCHEPTCVNPKHLCLEDGETNKSRGSCKLYGKREGYRCPHTPVCFGAKGMLPRLQLLKRSHSA